MIKATSRRGQLSIAVIIAVVIAVGIILYFVLREKSAVQGVPADIAPVFDYYLSCIEKETKAAVDLAGTQGGYIETPPYLPGSDYAPFSSQLNFLGFGVPYWYYISANGIIKEQVPMKKEIESQMENFVKIRLKDCDFESFARRGFVIEEGEPDVQINIQDAKIIALVDSEISVVKGESSARKSRYSVEISTDFGKMYSLAREIYDKEKKDAFLERYAEDVLRLYAPVDGVEIGCSPKVWKTQEVINDIKKGLEINIESLKFQGNYYSLKNEQSKYFVIDKRVDMPVSIIYSKEWPTKIEITGAEGELLIAQPLGNQAGLGVLGFCYSPYHYVYDLSFPVMFRIYNDKGELFQYPVSVIIDNNVPRQANLEPLIEQEEDVDVCGFKTQSVKIKVFDVSLSSVDSNISYQCFDKICKLGGTDKGVFEGKAPACLNGYVIADAIGYQSKKVLFSTNNESFADIVLDKKYDVELEIEVDGKPFNGNALISFIGENSITTVLPENRNISLVEGRYNISVYLYGNSSIVLPASTKRQCVQISKSGLLGLFGGTKEQCFDINIPESKIDEALVGGGNAEIYLLPVELEKGKLKIKANSFPKPDSIERIQYNYALLENSRLEVVA